MKQKELLSEVGDTAQGSKGRRAEQQAKGKGDASAKGTHPQGGDRRQGEQQAKGKLRYWGGRGW